MNRISVSSNGALLGDEISMATLGGEYLGWTGFFGWQKQSQHLGIHHIRWPSGINAEDRIESGSYAFDISTPTLVDNWPKSDGGKREGLAEMFAYANDLGASFSMIVPTGRYVELMMSDPVAARTWIVDDVTAFTARLFSGAFGTVPSDFVLEIGAEYYSTDAWAAHNSNPEIEDVFGLVFAEIVGAFSQAEEVYGSNVYDLAVQAARFQSWDDTVLEQDGELADAEAFIDSYVEMGVEQSIDALIWHRYVYMFEQTAHHLTPGQEEHTLTDHLELWESELGHPLELVVGWAAPDVDQAGEYPSNTYFDFGPRAAHTTLQMFSELVEAGADYATLYGIDSQWTGALSTGSTDPDEYTVSFHGEVYSMMTESVPGLRATNDFHRNYAPVDEQNNIISMDHVNVFGFSNGMDRSVTFSAAWDLSAPTVGISLSAPEYTFDFVSVAQLRPDGFNEFSGGFRVVPNATLDTGGNVNIEGVFDFDVVRTIHSNTLDLNVEQQILLSNATGRSVVALSGFGDNFEVLDGQSSRVVNGLDGNDTLVGSVQSDIILGGSGRDTINGGDGGDFLIGDDVSASSIFDWLEGGEFQFM